MFKEVSCLTARISLDQSTASSEAIARTTKRKRGGNYPAVISADPKIDEYVLADETDARRLLLGRPPKGTSTFDQSTTSNELHCKEQNSYSVTLLTPLSQLPSPPIQGSNSQSNLSATASSLDIPGEHPAPVAELVIKDSLPAAKLGNQITNSEWYPYLTVQLPYRYNSPPTGLDSVNMSRKHYVPWMYTLEGRSNSQFCEISIPSRNRARNFIFGQFLEGEGHQPSTTTYRGQDELLLYTSWPYQITLPENEAYLEPPPNLFSMLSDGSTTHIQGEDWVQTDLHALQSIPMP